MLANSELNTPLSNSASLSGSSSVCAKWLALFRRKDLPSGYSFLHDWALISIKVNANLPKKESMKLDKSP